MSTARSPASIALLALLLSFAGPLACGDGSTGVATCGDGKVQGDEECDDGNNKGGDGCSPTCRLVTAPMCGDGIVQLSLGEQCDDGNTEETDACTNDCLYAACGDGVVQAGLEECDDGNMNANDACTNKCKVARCGDGIVQEGLEQCDDGNADDTDSCLSSCVLARCGDGILQDEVEDCDDGNEDDTDSCRNDCRLPRCGDGIVQAGEQCDDDNLVDNDGCTNSCTFPVCGDGVVQRDEECDDGNEVDEDACSNTCVLARCGDGIVQIGEECDDQNLVNDDACTNACTAARCGDTITQAPEQCDDGNDVETDACTTVCENARCGDNFVGPGEQCDDGNTDEGDGCSANCRLPGCGDGILQAGEECDDGDFDETDECTSLCKNARCGDTFVQAGVEQCDDGNTVDTDACSNACQSARCGDGIVRAGVEQCDDGNTVNDDFCSNACKLPVCGNNVREGNEQCDDGNTTSGDGCSTGCLAELLEMEPNNTWQTANGPLETPTEVIGYIPTNTDVDYFKFVVTSSFVDVQIETFARDQSNTNCTGVDTVVTLLGTNGTTQLAQNDDKVTNVNACSKIDAVNHGGARRLGPGTYYVRVEAYGTSKITAGYRMEIRFSAECGNGSREGSEVCDDGNQVDTDACTNACLVRPVCNDGKIVFPEECDDGNRTNGDGCSSTCKLELKNEIEPNNTIAQAGTSGHPVITMRGRIKGSISASGDVDFFKLVMPEGGTRVVHIETFGATPFECPTSVDTALRLYNSSGTRLVTADADASSSVPEASKRSDLDSGMNKCSLLSYPLGAGTYYIEVLHQAGTGTIGTYHLDVNVTRYDSTLGPESEANDSIATADLIYGVGSHITASTDWIDLDYFKFVLPQPMSVRIEHVDNGYACKTGSGTGETEIRLYDSNNKELAYDDNDGRGNCARIDGINPGTGSDAGARNLMAGTYYIRVANNSFSSYSYRLVLWAR